MFRKRNFSFINDVVCKAESSPSKSLIQESSSGSPLINFGQHKTVKIIEDQSKDIAYVSGTPVSITPSPIKKTKLTSTLPESNITAYSSEKEALKEEIRTLNNQIKQRVIVIRDIKERTLELKAQRHILDDYVDIAVEGQYEVRDLLNDIFNRGNQLASRASHLLDEARRRHQQKYEKMVFELTNSLETTEITITNKIQRIEHDIELHKRTLMTIECQNRQKLSQAVEVKTIVQEDHYEMAKFDTTAAKDDANCSNQVDKDPRLEPNYEEIQTDQNYDDCIIIDDSQGHITGDKNGDIESGAKTPASLENYTGNNADNSGTTVTAELDDDEETDIEDLKEDDLERSFTPCQAQRPKNI